MSLTGGILPGFPQRTSLRCYPRWPQNDTELHRYVKGTVHERKREQLRARAPSCPSPTEPRPAHTSCWLPVGPQRSNGREVGSPRLLLGSVEFVARWKIAMVVGLRQRVVSAERQTCRRAVTATCRVNATCDGARGLSGQRASVTKRQV